MLTVLGQRLSGNIVIEKAAALSASGAVDPARSVLKVGLSNVSLSLGGAQPLVTLTDGSALLLLEARRAGRTDPAAPSPWPSHRSR